MSTPRIRGQSAGNARTGHVDAPALPISMGKRSEQARPMAGQQAIRTGRYLYAVIPGSEATSEQMGRDAGGSYGPIGIDGRDVYTILNGSVAAVVSDVPKESIRPDRRRLAAHHEVLKLLMARCTTLPISFGTIADNSEAVCELLSSGRDALVEQLQRVESKVEMGLRLSWDVPNIFQYIVSTHAELRTLRDEMFRGGREPSRDDKIELGRLFDRIVNEDRVVHTETVVNIVQPRCFELRENRLRNECEVMNLACLVGRCAQKDFEEGVFEAAKLFDDNFSFDFNGPWPPYNFVDVALRM